MVGSDYDFKGQILGMAQHQIVRKKGFNVNFNTQMNRQALIQMNDMKAPASSGLNNMLSDEMKESIMSKIQNESRIDDLDGVDLQNFAVMIKNQAMKRAN